MQRQCCRTLYNNSRVLRFVAAFDDYHLLEARLFIELFTIGDTIFNRIEGQCTRQFRKDNGVVRVPCADVIALLHYIAFFHPQECTIGNVVADQNLVSVVRIHNPNFARTTHNNRLCVTFSIF